MSGLELTEAELTKLNRGRLLRSEAGVLLPLLTERKAGALSRLIANFRAGGSDLLIITAELTALHDLEHELNKNIREAESLERRIYGDPVGGE